MAERNNNTNIGVGYYGVHDPETTKLYLNALLESQKRWDLAKDYILNTAQTIGELSIDPRSKDEVNKYLENFTNSIQENINTNYNGDYGAGLDFVKEQIINARKIIPLINEAYKNFETLKQVYNNLISQNKITGRYSYKPSDDGEDESNGINKKEIIFTPASFEEFYKNPYLIFDNNTLTYNNTNLNPKMKWDADSFIQKILTPLINNTIGNSYYKVGSPIKNVPSYKTVFKYSESIKGMNYEDFIKFINTPKGQEYLDNVVTDMFQDPTAIEEFGNDRDLAKQFVINELQDKLQKSKITDVNIENNINLNNGDDQNDQNFQNNSNLISEPFVVNNKLLKNPDRRGSENKIIDTLNDIMNTLNKDYNSEYVFNTTTETYIEYKTRRDPLIKFDKVTISGYLNDNSLYTLDYPIVKGLLKKLGIIETIDGIEYFYPKKFKAFYNIYKDKYTHITAPSFNVVNSNTFNALSNFISHTGPIDNISEIKFSFEKSTPNIKVRKKYEKDFTSYEIQNPTLVEYYTVGHKIQESEFYKNYEIGTTFHINEKVTINGNLIEQIKIKDYKLTNNNDYITVLEVKFQNGNTLELDTNNFLKYLTQDMVNLMQGMTNSKN